MGKLWLLSLILIGAVVATPTLALDPYNGKLLEEEPTGPADELGLSGLSIGGGFEGVTAGQLTISGSVAYTFESPTPIGGLDLYFGVEGSTGLNLPTNTFETWVYGKGGPEIMPGTWLYGVGGLGTIGGTPVYGFGIGVERQIAPSWSISAEGLAQGAFGSSVSELGLRVTAHYYPRVEGAGKPENPLAFLGLNGPTEHDVYVGGSATVFPGNSQVTPAIEVGVNCMHGADLEFGLRGRAGIILPYNEFELSGGVTAGFRIADNFKVYGFGELNSYGGTLLNSFGAGGQFQVAPNYGVYGEVFSIAKLGSIGAGEIGLRAGFRYNFEPIDTRVEPGMDNYGH